MTGPIIVWLRQDLRLADNRALAAAVDTGRPIVPLFILDDASAGEWALGAASRWWLHHSLATLADSIHQLGATLILRRGDTRACLQAVASETGASAIHLTRGYAPWQVNVEASVHSGCTAAGITVRRFAGNLLAEPESIKTQSGDPYRVFTPFWRALLAAGDPGPPLPAPKRLTAPARAPSSDNLADWNLRPTRPDWAGGLRETWSPGEAGAARRLAAFLNSGMADYAEARDRPDQPGTSMLSPHLHFGEISPRQIWTAIEHARARHPAQTAGGASFLREVGWREFSYHLLHHWPQLPDAPFRPEFGDFPWIQDNQHRQAAITAWQRGRTGYPIVDAGMRELWQAGWMHNRVRMIAASFLTKHLLVPWQNGARWFWDTLVDADLANNSASWQWVAGSGADAAPYFRIFNPVLQGQKFDPDGDYIRRYVPELAGLPARYIHAPWTAPDAILASAGVQLGQTYPHPIVDHAAARQRALDAYAAMRQRAEK